MEVEVALAVGPELLVGDQEGLVDRISVGELIHVAAGHAADRFGARGTKVAEPGQRPDRGLIVGGCRAPGSRDARALRAAVGAGPAPGPTMPRQREGRGSRAAGPAGDSDGRRGSRCRSVRRRAESGTPGQRRADDARRGQAGDRRGPTTRICSSRLVGKESCGSLLFGSMTTPRKYGPGSSAASPPRR